MHESIHEPAADDQLPFLATGTKATGQYRCYGCGYGITIHTALPECPMCAGTTWEASPWTPFSGTAEFRRLVRRSAAKQL
jgi:rubredoxin